MRSERLAALALLALAVSSASAPPRAAAAPPDIDAIRGAAPGRSAERRPIVTGVPVYPDRARDERRTGDVVVCFDVRPDGRVVRPLVKRSSDRIFNRAALRAARETRYAPAPPGAFNAATSECMTFRFELESLARERQEQRAEES